MSEKLDTHISAAFTAAEVAKLEKLSKKADRTRSAELRRAVREYIERAEAAA